MRTTYHEPGWPVFVALLPASNDESEMAKTAAVRKL